MKGNGSSYYHQNNNLKVVIPFAIYLDPLLHSIISIKKNKYYHF